jgi:hypothetical protein
MTVYRNFGTRRCNSAEHLSLGGGAAKTSGVGVPASADQ